PSFEGVKKALRYAFSRQELLGTYFIDIVAMFFAFPQALYPALAAIYGDGYVGLFPAAIAIGALLASVTSGWASRVHRHGAMVIGAALLWGVGILFFGLVDGIVPALFFLGVAGFFDMVSGIFRGAIWNQTIPNYLRGRMASIEMVSYLTGPMLGSAKMGIVAEWYGVKFALVSGGILCIIAVGLMALFLPKFAVYDGRDGVRQREREEAERAELSRVSESEF
ncbi:MAG: MFS transporter, partial [Acidobacteria bacterium]|nr:MFS transporter [Acidobacteriota bacterium]